MFSLFFLDVLSLVLVRLFAYFLLNQFIMWIPNSLEIILDPLSESQSSFLGIPLYTIFFGRKVPASSSISFSSHP